jgi:flavin-dependent dehydrogenase
MNGFDVAIVGGGPGGLAAALEVRRAGLSCVVIERQHAPVDKACGEGLMPSGLAALETWGVRSRIDARDCASFAAIRWVQEDNRFVEAALPAPGGMGIRRVALHRAFAETAREAGVELREGCTAHAHRLTGQGVELDTDSGTVAARLLVAADGLHSPLRRAAGLELEASGPRRFGLRRHFALSPWGSRVEVHFAEGLEAYVTPAGANRVGVAFLWEDGRVPPPISFDALLKRFPALADRLAPAASDSRPIGAGPLLQRVRGSVWGRLVLLGDAAGYVDAITGEGLSLAFEQAKALGRLLPGAIENPGLLTAYDDASARAFRSYARLASGLVAMARRPALRRAALNRLVARPEIFGFLLRRLTAPREGH